MYESVVQVNDFAMDASTGNAHVCESGGDGPYLPGVSNAVELQIGAAMYDQFDRVVLALPYCASLQANGATVAGVGERPGKLVWMNGLEDDAASFALTLVHELGHTNGAGHAEFGDDSFGNMFSIMGGAENLPAGHFTIGAKASFGWLDAETNVQNLGTPALCLANPYCISQGEFWVHAHDTGEVFASDKLYGLKLHTVDANHYVWVELRSKYYSLRGALLTWAYEGADDVFGPTQLLDFATTTANQSDAFVPVGESFFYDFGRTNAHVRVLEADEEKSAIKVRVEYVSTSALSTQLDALESVSCATSTSSSQSTQLFAFFLEDPSRIAFTQTCVDVDMLDDNVAQPGLYVYERAPAHLFMNISGGLAANVGLRATDSNVGSGARLFIPLYTDCTSATCAVDVVFEPKFTGLWSVVPDTTVNDKPVYTATLSGSKYYFSFRNQYMPALGGKRDLWFITSSLGANSYHAYVQPPESGMLLADIGTNALAASYTNEANEAIAVTSGLSFACSATKVTGEIRDHFTSAYQDIYESVPLGRTRYHAFTRDNFVLVHGVPSSGFSFEAECETLYCAENRYWDEDAGLCQACPEGLVSQVASTGSEACVEPCENLFLRATGITESNYGADGLYVPSGYLYNGVQSWIVHSAATRSRSFAIYKLANVWVLGPSVGDTAYWQILLEADVDHPMLARDEVDGFELSCSCDALPTCAACPADTLPDPLSSSACFTPCLELEVTAGTDLDGTYAYAGHTNGRPSFASATHILFATIAGAWRIDRSSTESKRASHPTELTYWPTGLTSSAWTLTGVAGSQDISIACADASAVDLDSYRSWIGFADTRTSSPNASSDDRLIIDLFFPPPTPSRTQFPTAFPTKSPTKLPTASPTTKLPTKAPTKTPTKTPTKSPTTSPTTRSPSKYPTLSPTQLATTKPPSKSPTMEPTTLSSEIVTAAPSAAAPTLAPTLAPSAGGSATTDVTILTGENGDDTTPTAPPTSSAGAGSAGAGSSNIKTVASWVAGVLGGMVFVVALLVTRDMRTKRARRARPNTTLGPHVGPPPSPVSPGPPLAPPPGLELSPMYYGGARGGADDVYAYDVNPMF